MHFYIGCVKFIIGWEYDNPKDPLVTKILLKAPDGRVITSTTVKRYHKDPQNKELARRHSIAKLLKENKVRKENRKIVWEAYLLRNLK